MKDWQKLLLMVVVLFLAMSLLSIWFFAWINSKIDTEEDSGVSEVAFCRRYPISTYPEGVYYCDCYCGNIQQSAALRIYNPPSAGESFGIADQRSPPGVCISHPKK